MNIDWLKNGFITWSAQAMPKYMRRNGNRRSLRVPFIADVFWKRKVFIYNGIFGWFITNGDICLVKDEDILYLCKDLIFRDGISALNEQPNLQTENDAINFALANGFELGN